MSVINEEWTREKFVPFNPNDKRTLSYVTDTRNNQRWCVSKGSPQITLNMCMAELGARDTRRVEEAIDMYAARGYRTLGVARRSLPPLGAPIDASGAGGVDSKGDDGSAAAAMEGGAWEFLGLVSMFDPPRIDTKETIEAAQGLGIEVKMITGDHKAIGKDTARRLNMGTNILGTHIFQKLDTFGAHRGELDYTDMVEHADGFAEVFPEHKVGNGTNTHTRTRTRMLYRTPVCMCAVCIDVCGVPPACNYI